MRLLALAALCACGSGPPVRPAAPGDALTFDGRLERGPIGFAAAELAGLPQRTLQGVDPRSGRAATFAGVHVQALLGEWVAPRRGADVAVFHGRGGIRVAVPFNAIRQSKPALAIAADGRPVGEWDAGAGPLLLAWPTAEAPGLDTDPRQRWWWVRGVTRVEVAAWQEAYGRALRVPAGARDEARPGAETFASQCIHCHRLRGAGGEAGPDLTSWLEGRPAGALARALRGHLAARSGIASAPDLAPGAVAQLEAFLQAVHLSGPDRPQDEVGEPERAPPAVAPSPPR
jgi:hypothetical protein